METSATMDSRLSSASQTVSKDTRLCPLQRTNFSAASTLTRARPTMPKIGYPATACEISQKDEHSAASLCNDKAKISAFLTPRFNTKICASSTTIAWSTSARLHLTRNNHYPSHAFWRQNLSKQAMASNHAEEPEPRPEDAQFEKEIVPEVVSSTPDPPVDDPGFSDLHKVFTAPVEHWKESWNQVSQISREQGEMTRRRVLGTPMYMSLASIFGASWSDGNAHALVRAVIDASKAPTKSFDPTDKRLREAAVTFQNALNATTVVEEEELWTQVIEKYGELEAEWVADIVSRAYGNRGNARSRQGKLDQALEDYDKSIMLAPYAADPVLNRGVVLESLGRFDEASADYVAVLRAQPKDPAAWNNLGNVKAAQNRWEDALVGYAKAVELAPAFSFAAANYALALYQVGRVNEAVKQFRSLLRKYPEFPDMRAALAVSLYAEGLTAEAESNWERLEDRRYRDRVWVKNTRRWPPRLVDDLESFLDVTSSKRSAV